MNLDKYTQLLIDSSKSADIPARELRLSLRQIPHVNINKLLHPNPEIRLDAIKKIVESDTNAKLAVLLQLLSIEKDLEIRFYLRKSLNSLNDNYPYWSEQELNKQLLCDFLDDPQKKHKILSMLIRSSQTHFADTLREISLSKSGDIDIDLTALTLLRNSSQPQDKVLSKYLVRTDEYILCETIDVIGQVGSLKLKARLINFLNSNSEKVTKKIQETLALLGNDKLKQVIQFASKGSNPATLISICDLIHDLQWYEGQDILDSLKRSAVETVRLRAKQTSKSLAELKHRAQLLGDKLIKVAHTMFPNDSLSEIQNNLNPVEIATVIKIISTSNLENKRKVRILQYFLEYPDHRVRANIIESFSDLIGENNQKWFIKFLNDANNRVRGNAWVALAQSDLEEYFKEELNQSLTSLILDEREMYQRTAVYCLNTLTDANHYREHVPKLLTSQHQIVRQRSVELALKLDLNSENIFHNKIEKTEYADVIQQLDIVQKFRKSGFLDSLEKKLLTEAVDTKQEILENMKLLPPMDFLKDILQEAWIRATFPDIKFKLLQVIKKQNSDLALECSESIQLKGLSPLSCLCFLIRLEKNVPGTTETALSLWSPSIILHKQLASLLVQIIPVLIAKMQLIKVKEILLYMINSPLEFADDWTNVLSVVPPADDELIDSLLKIIFDVSEYSKSNIIDYLLLSYSKNKLLEVLHQKMKKHNREFDSETLHNFIKKIS